MNKITVEFSESETAIVFASLGLYVIHLEELKIHSKASSILTRSKDTQKLMLKIRNSGFKNKAFFKKVSETIGTWSEGKH